MARRPPSALMIVGVLALGGLVAVASNGASVWAPPRQGAVNRAEVLAIVVVIFALGLTVAGAMTFALHRRLTAGSPGAPPWRAALLRALPTTVVALVIVSLLAITRMDLERGAVAGDSSGEAFTFPGRPGNPLSILGWFSSPLKAGEGEPDAEGAGGSGPESGRLQSLLLLAAVALAVAGAVWWHTSRSRRSSHDGSAGDADHDAAHGAVLGSIDAMLADPDPNTAIIGAYARLLEGLAGAGMPRRDYEGPVEHLHRVLTVLRVHPDPLRELIELFEIARFSTHALTSSHRERALDALREVAEDLGSGSASPRATAAPPALGSRA